MMNFLMNSMLNLMILLILLITWVKSMINLNMGGGWADGKRTQWLGVLILRKTERTAEFVEGKGESEWKKLDVYSSGGQSMARGLAEAGSSLSFSVSYTMSSPPLSFPLSFSVSS